MSEVHTNTQIGTLRDGSPPKPDPRQWLEKIGRDMKTGGEILLLSPEVQEDLRTRLSACEARLNQLFPSAIHAERKNITAVTKFMGTPEFFEEAILEGNEVPNDLRKLIDLMTKTFDTMGLRSFDGKTVMVHTTVYHPESDPRQATNNEAFATARHEMVHGKVEPKLVSVSPSRQERRTGSKIVTLENGQIIDVKHACLYEAQTDALAVVSSHPEVKSWDEIFHLYLEERAGDSSEYGFQMSALTRLMDFAYPDFFTGLTALGESYFRCDSEGFISALSSKIKERGQPETETQFDTFLKLSEANNAPGMTQAVTRLLNSVRSAKVA
ncbi:MAG: hypothetical protein AAB697_03000 [Patescibacteria group bacterium]